MSGRARPHAVFLGLLLAVGPVASARAASETRSAPTQSGWWNRLQGPAEGEPDGNPVRPFVPAVPKPPNVRADAARPLAGNGVVLAVDSAGSPSPVQVSWLDVDSGHVAVELTATPAAPAPAPSAGAGPSAPKAAAAASPVPAVAAPSVDSAAAARAFPAGSGGISADPFAYPSGQPTFAAIEPSGTATAGSGAPPAPPAEHEAALTVPPAPP